MRATLAQPLGQLAVERDMLTQLQVQGILDLQPDFQQPFGKIALSLGYLTESQLGELLLAQAARSKRYEDILVEKGTIITQVLIVERRRYYERLGHQAEGTFAGS